MSGSVNGDTGGYGTDLVVSNRPMGIGAMEVLGELGWVRISGTTSLDGESVG